MGKILTYLILFILLFYILKFLVRIFYRLKSNDSGVKSAPPQEKKSQIDKDKAVDAKYEDL